MVIFSIFYFWNFAFERENLVKMYTRTTSLDFMKHSLGKITDSVSDDYVEKQEEMKKMSGHF